MSWLLSLLASLGIAAAGTLFGGFLASRATEWLRVSSREGYAGYWVVFMALLAGVFSLVAALLVLRLGGIAQPFPAILAAAATALGAIALAGLFAWLCRERRPGSGALPELELELRGPPGGATLAGDSAVLYAYVSANRAPMQPVDFDRGALREAEGRWLLPGRLTLHTRRPGRYLTLGGTRLNNANVYFYLGPEMIELLAPGAWSDWMKASPSGNLSPENDGEHFELRIRPLPAGA